MSTAATKIRVSEFKPMAKSIANRVARENTCMDASEINAVALESLYDAYRSFNADSGAVFSSFARFVVHKNLYRFITRSKVRPLSVNLSECDRIVFDLDRLDDLGAKSIVENWISRLDDRQKLQIFLKYKN